MQLVFCCCFLHVASAAGPKPRGPSETGRRLVLSSQTAEQILCQEETTAGLIKARGSYRSPLIGGLENGNIWLLAVRTERMQKLWKHEGWMEDNPTHMSL